MLLEYFSSVMNRIKIMKKNPTCVFGKNFLIEDSQLGKHNTFFDNVFISGSSIGDFTFIQKNTNVINADVGKFCSIAAGVRIGLGSHPLSYVSTHPSFYSASQPLAKTFAKQDIFLPFKKTFIGHDVWIGENALIKDGVRIGTGAVVGAGAIATKDVPEYAIVVGAPAKIVRFRFDEATRQKIMKTQWWDKSARWLEENFDLFQSPEIFLTKQ